MPPGKFNPLPDAHRQAPPQVLPPCLPSHMTEEMLNPAKEAPQAIILSVYLGAVTGFVFLISAFFCIGDLEATATTPTGVPLIQIFYDSTSSVSGATTLAAMITV